MGLGARGREKRKRFNMYTSFSNPYHATIWMMRKKADTAAHTPSEVLEGRGKEGLTLPPVFFFNPPLPSVPEILMCWVHRAQRTVFGASHCVTASLERTALRRHARQEQRWTWCWPQHSNLQATCPQKACRHWSTEEGRARTKDLGQSDHRFAGTEKKGWENRREALSLKTILFQSLEAICLPAERGLHAILRAVKREQACLISWRSNS